MTVEQFLNTIKSHQKQLNQLMNRTLPVKGGAMAKAHFQENFIKGGFVNNGLQKWKPAKRTLSGKKAALANYKTLLSSRNHLFSSIAYVPGNGMVKIINPVEYAAIHNEGGFINKPESKRDLYFKVDFETGVSRFAKKKKANFQQNVTIGAHKVEMPKRQFIGESRELNDKLVKLTEDEIRKIITP